MYKIIDHALALFFTAVAAVAGVVGTITSILAIPRKDLHSAVFFGILAVMFAVIAYLLFKEFKQDSHD